MLKSGMDISSGWDMHQTLLVRMRIRTRRPTRMRNLTVWYACFGTLTNQRVMHVLKIKKAKDVGYYQFTPVNVKKIFF